MEIKIPTINLMQCWNVALLQTQSTNWIGNLNAATNQTLIKNIILHHILNSIYD